MFNLNSNTRLTAENLANTFAAADCFQEALNYDNGLYAYYMDVLEYDAEEALNAALTGAQCHDLVKALDLHVTIKTLELIGG